MRAAAVCQQGLYCNLLDYPARCDKPGKAGRDCMDDEACAKGFVCDLQAVESKCMKVTTAACG
jgi:hypothetical protein